jgi:hypothetical protein
LDVIGLVRNNENIIIRKSPFRLVKQSRNESVRSSNTTFTFNQNKIVKLATKKSSKNKYDIVLNQNNFEFRNSMNPEFSLKIQKAISSKYNQQSLSDRLMRESERNYKSFYLDSFSKVFFYKIIDFRMPKTVKCKNIMISCNFYKTIDL